MRIPGEWLVCDDGVIRPILEVKVAGIDGRQYVDNFLIDTGADRTVLSAAFFARLRLPSRPAPAGTALGGIAGATPFVIVNTALYLTRHDGGIATVRGDFATFTDPAATEMSIVGGDVLMHFDLILSRRHDHVLLLSGNHDYQVTP